ncbi:tubulin beta-1 chain-like [Lasioglossum baleicum]|uniref:tubulin beta-1 chain-like n=1 Tax=Lasioglossum baleicum TaxID=434251 RepID=UPI003FCE79C3
MREIVHVQLGQCGNNVGRKFWEVITDEHGLGVDGVYAGDSDMQLNNIEVYFKEGPARRYVPRAILIDLDPASLPPALSTKCGGLFNPENFVVGCESAGNNWAKGYYSEGAELVENALNVIRREADACDMMQGIQMVRSLGGGTGSGVGSLLMTKLRDEYPDRIVKCYSVMPSSKMSDVVVEPYNAVLGLCTSIDCVNLSFCMDNHALHRICTKLLRISTPTYADTNHLISACMAGVTCCFRFPGQPTTDLRKMHVNLVPFPKLHFFVAGYAPLTSRSAAQYKVASVNELARGIFDPKNAFVDYDPFLGKMMAVAVIFRGAASSKRVEEQMSNLQSKNSSSFVEWIANNVQSAICKVAPRGVSMNATLISNTTAFQEPLKRLMSGFDEMLKRMAYTHWYTAEGMDESEFEEARGKMRDLIDEYQPQTNH